MRTKLKGVALSIETIIIIVICAVVLVLIALFFPSIFNFTGSEIIFQGDLEKECLDWQKYDYDPAYFSEDFYPKLSARFGDASAARSYCTAISVK